MQLDRRPKLAGFCREIDEIEFPQLKKLHIEGLPQIKCPFPNNSHMSSDSEGNHNAFMQSVFPPKAALPLRGKILNIERKNEAAMYKNEQIQNLILGLGLGVK
ncbi:unnamed protein product [Camellia sinensis]